VNEESALVTPEASNHEMFRQTIEELDRNLVTSRRGSIAALLATLVAMAGSFVFATLSPNGDWETTGIVDGVLFVALIFLVYTIRRHKNTKAIRDRLSQQLDISIKQRIRAEKLYGLSILDPLTGLHNRRFGEERLKEEIARAERNSDALAVLLLDLDYFKEINDQFGHAAGDLALKAFSRKLRKAIRAVDVPVRLGGDEFLIILPECPRENVDVILSRIGSPQIEFNGESITIGYSVGRSHYQVCDTPETLISRADDTLYVQKADRPERKDLRAGQPAKSANATAGTGPQGAGPVGNEPVGKVVAENLPAAAAPVRTGPPPYSGRPGQSVITKGASALLNELDEQAEVTRMNFSGTLADPIERTVPPHKRGS
jgi:diguanylate cyclase (GGDEF)-like protein